MVSQKLRSAPLLLKLSNPSLLKTTDFDKNNKLVFGDTSTFILSTGRTGTKFLADLAGQLEDVTALHEPRPSYMLQAWSSAYLEGKVSDDYMKRIFVAKRHKIANNTTTPLFIESNHFIDGFVSHINEIVQSPTIIHIVRDPRDFITSMINRGNDSGLKLLFNKIVPYFAHTEPGYYRLTMTPIEREACHWVGMNRELSNFGKTHSNYHMFKFEDIFESSDALEPVFTAIGLTENQINTLDLTAAYRNPSRRTGKRAHPSWHKWSDVECRTVHELCGELMYEYGYGAEPEWQARISG